MRDDIHNRVPLSPAFRSLLKRCTNAAYQQQPEGLQKFAIRAVQSMIASGCSQDVIRRLDAEAKTPNLFGSQIVSLPHASAIQSDLVDALRCGNDAATALAIAAKAQVNGMSLEVEAGLRAAGASRREAASAAMAMREALIGSAETAAAHFVSGTRPAIPASELQLTSLLPLGPAARVGV